MHRWTTALVLVIGCAGEGTSADGEDETGTGTETDGTEGGATTLTTAGPTTSAGTTATTQGGTTAGSASADSTDDGTTTAGEATTADESSAGSEDRCPPGQEGCLCDLGSTCADGLECIDGTCVAVAACEQPEGEPNDDEASAVALADAECGAEPAMQPGALDGDESDWFAYALTGDFCPFGEASVTVTNGDELDLTVCLFAVCESGTSMATCGFANGLDEATSPDGHEGCCGTNQTSIDQANCGFMAPLPSTVHVQITGAPTKECLPYDLSWSY